MPCNTLIPALWICAGTLVLLAGCDRGETPAQPAGDEPVAATADTGPRAPAHIYATECAICHEGNVPKAPHSVTFQLIGPEAILAALTQGVMKEQGAKLSPAEREGVAEFLGGSKLGASQQQPPPACADDRKGFDFSTRPAVPDWGMTRANTRFIDGKTADVPVERIQDLALEWAFAYPGATRARSQPTVAGNAIYVGSQNGMVYALDFASGCVRWSYQAEAEVRNAPAIDVTGANAETNPRAYFGDLIGNVYAVDAVTGALLWRHLVDDHPKVAITGSPRVHEGRIYVPMSSNEWAAAADPAYECCTFRGGVAALEAATGAPVWKSYSIPEAPQPAKPNSAGTKTWHPAGAPVWNSPTIDVKRRRLYVGTGEAYTSPAADTSDSVLAIALEDGKLLWHYQSISGDAWNMACFIGGGANCPEENGPDLDIGAPPVLVTLDDGRDVLVVGQKSGDAFALDPDDGKVIWKRRLGRGGFAGGVHWGLAAAGTQVYAPNADTLILPTDADRGEAKPGLFALDAATGETRWFTPAPEVCTEKTRPACDPGLSAPATAIPGAVFAGGFDGVLRAYDASDGHVIWQYETNREFEALGGLAAHGGSIESAGPVVAHGAVLVNSGYLFGARMPGNVLLKFSVPPETVASD
jgi:polyvinyl alcohol dehydrogenase (cytochrome)